MSRVRKLPLEQWDPALRQMTDVDHGTPLEQLVGGVMANQPALAKAMMGFAGQMWAGSTLPRRLLELVRLRIAFHNQCRSCMAMRYQSAVEDGLDEGAVCSLEKPLEAADLSPREKAAIAYADISSTNHFAISDETFAELRRHFSELEIIELGMFVAYFIGFGRLAAAWDMVEELPASFQDKSAKAAPWTHESLVMRG
ncbi:carboxymuconolactone decarboxylase family protein [Phenylobacterium sp. LjRoot219]|uniref:carboxymuconolactone decarboxylase family protein n=1 Tax=Phenylobacterium sp. LjRoot219 TaxID=3342283 RepID=UPI003ECD715D